MEASDLFPKYLKNRERKQNTANPRDATQGKNSPHQQHSCPTALRSTSTHISTSSALHCKVCNPLTFTPKGFQFILNLTLWDTSSPQSQLKLLRRTVSRVQMPSVSRHSSQSSQCFLTFVSFTPSQETLQHRREREVPKRNSLIPQVQMFGVQQCQVWFPPQLLAIL